MVAVGHRQREFRRQQVDRGGAAPHTGDIGVAVTALKRCSAGCDGYRKNIQIWPFGRLHGLAHRAYYCQRSRRERYPPTMKRVTSVLASAFVMVLVTAGSALAQSGYEPSDTPPSVAAGGGSNGGTAFTGGDITFGALAAIALLAIGVTALIVARKRAARLSG